MMPEKKVATSDRWKMWVSSGITIKFKTQKSNFTQSLSNYSKSSHQRRKFEKFEKSMEKVMDTLSTNMKQKNILKEYEEERWKKELEMEERRRH